MRAVQYLAIASLSALSAPALAQAPTDRVKLDVGRAELQVIGQGLMKMPYETAAPLLIELQKQLEAQTPKPEGLGAGGTGGIVKPEASVSAPTSAKK